MLYLNYNYSIERIINYILKDKYLQNIEGGIKEYSRKNYTKNKELDENGFDFWYVNPIINNGLFKQTKLIQIFHISEEDYITIKVFYKKNFNKYKVNKNNIKTILSIIKNEIFNTENYKNLMIL